MAIFFGKNRKKTENTLELDVKEMSANQLYIRGMQELIRDDSESALLFLKECVKKDSDNVDAYIRVGDIFREKKAVSKAIMIHYEILLRDNLDFYLKRTALKSLVKDYRAMIENSQTPAVNVRNMLINLSQSSYSKEFLIEMYNAYLENKLYNITLEYVLKSKKMQSWVNVGVVYYLSALEDLDSLKFESALRKLNEASNMLKNVSEVDFYKGVCYYKIEDYTNAYQSLNKVIHLFPFFFRDYEDILFKIGKYSEIGTVISRMSDSIEDNADLLFVCVDFKLRTSDNEGAIKFLESFLKKKKEIAEFDSDYNSALLMLIRILSKENDIELVQDSFVNFLTEKFDTVSVAAREVECESCKGKIIENMRICSVCGKY